MGPQALSGVTVVALEQAVAAPFATRQLADWGARVIKIERPGTGDFARHYDETVHGQSSHFVWINRGKESLTLDVKSPDGQKILRQLMGQADVLVQNLKPGSLEKMGWHRDAIRRDFPKLIYCNISGYGPDGPYYERKAYDLLIQAESGLLSITGTEESPAKVGVSIGDIAAGMYALTSILMALIHRNQTHEGTIIDVSMLEALAEWMGYPLNFGHFSGQAPDRTGAHHATIAPYGPYPTLGGAEVFLGVQNEREWAAFCTDVLKMPGMRDDPRFESNSLRVTHRTALNGAIQEVFSQLALKDVLDRLDRAGIAYARLNTIEDLWDHPQLRARHRFRPVSTPGGLMEALLPPMNFLDAEPTMGDIPSLGRHTDGILAELGWTAEEIQRLREKGVV